MIWSGVWLAVSAGPARAEDNDLVLSRLGTCIDDTGAPDATCGNAVDVIGSNIDFRSLASELGVVMAPRLIEPADTLGFGGFQFSADIAFTSIDSDASYWRGREDPAGDSVLQTVGLTARKGIWLPVPSFEVGLGVLHLVDSHIWAAQGYAKFALHEGFHDFPLPSLSVRGAASRMTGSDALDLTVASIDVTLSKSFGIAGSFNLAPYAGWNWLIIVPRSEVIDKTPHIDARDVMSDQNLSFVFKDQDDIIRNRIFAGLKFKYYVFVLGLEANFALEGTSSDNRGGTDLDCSLAISPTIDCDATDEAKLQSTYSVSIGMDF